jgi:hypothetical protein
MKTIFRRFGAFFLPLLLASTIMAGDIPIPPKRSIEAPPVENGKKTVPLPLITELAGLLLRIL